MAIRVNGVTVAGGYTATTGSGLPDGGTAGQILEKTETGAQWADKPVVYVNVSDSTSDMSSSQINQYISDGYAVFVVTILKGQTYVLPLTLRGSGNSVTFALFIGDRIINCRISDTTATVSEVMLDASRVQFDPGASGLAADNAQDAIEELAGKSGITQSQADARYLQLSGGTIEVPAIGNGSPSVALRLRNTGDSSSLNRHGGPYFEFETPDGEIVREYINFDDGYATVLFHDAENDDLVMLSGLLDPVNGADAATKAYVDGLVGNINSVLDAINGEVS